MGPWYAGGSRIRVPLFEIGILDHIGLREKVSESLTVFCEVRQQTCGNSSKEEWVYLDQAKRRPYRRSAETRRISFQIDHANSGKPLAESDAVHALDRGVKPFLS